MFRFIAASTLGLMAIATLNAGQLYYLGGAGGLVTTANTPPTPDTAYFVNGTSTSCAGGSGCLTTGNQGVFQSTTNSNWISKGFSSSLFGSATGLGTPVPGSGLYTPASGGPSFYLSSQGQVADFGYGSVSGVSVPGTYSLTIPVGLYDVDNVYTMLQDYWATGTGTPTSVEFEFSDTSNGSDPGGTFFDTVALTNGQQIRSATDCTSGTFAGPITTANPTGTGTCAAPGPNAPATTLAVGAQGLTGVFSGSVTGTNTVNVTATNIYDSSYTSGGSGMTTGGYIGTTGNIVLDEQNFSFGSQFSSDYLVAIIVNNQMNPGASKIMLSAVDVDQAPEPSTILLLLTGIGSIGLSRIRRNK